MAKDDDADDVAAKPTLPPNAGHLRSINIRTLKNGFISSASYDAAKIPKDSMCRSYVPDEEYALTDREAVHAFVDAIFDTAPKPKEKAVEAIARSGRRPVKRMSGRVCRIQRLVARPQCGE